MIALHWLCQYISLYWLMKSCDRVGLNLKSTCYIHRPLDNPIMIGVIICVVIVIIIVVVVVVYVMTFIISSNLI